jgi:hypothetical protein
LARGTGEGMRMRRGTGGVAALLSLGLVVGGPAAAADDWELVDDADGVRVWRREVPDSPVLAFRGAGEVSVPIGRLVGLLADSSLGPEWVDLLVESRRLRESSGLETILYNRYDLAWPIQDRDYVMRRVLSIDPEARVVTAAYRSIEDSSAPIQDCCVRAETNPTSWRFTQLGPSRTRVEVEVFTDPKGSIPAWLVNVVQSDWPRNSIRRLAERAAAPDVEPHPALAGW